ncbi:MAG: cytochrome c oxidase assembly protein [Gammaproteobacteria bacterium]|nr:cytochrome c oxidase assembly protein [Gammaproteobacteria bacterium]MBL6998682.1 cytochrome c oxidase assembly protein [Gammaproteobacteria bacterium]
MSDHKPQAKGKKTSLILGGLGIGMFAFGFALVPLYNLVCSISGINGIATAANRSEVVMSQVDTDRLITVEFDSTLNDGLPWKIEKPPAKIKVHPGEMHQISYRATNLSNKAIKVQAIPGITPWQATEYFNKTVCFCFETQTLEAGESREMDLQFVINRDLPEEYKTITLSYTFMNTDRSRI